MHAAWLSKEPSTELAVYVVWSPQLGASERHVAGATRLIPDPRVRHYWDGDRLVGRAYQAQMGMSEPAWDFWLLFDRDATWRDSVPRPVWWEHQVSGLPDSLYLDPHRFARRAAELLAEPR